MNDQTNEGFDYLLWVSGIALLLGAPSLYYIYCGDIIYGITLLIFPALYLVNRLAVRFMNEIESGCVLAIILALTLIIGTGIRLMSKRAESAPANNISQENITQQGT